MVLPVNLVEQVDSRVQRPLHEPVESLDVQLSSGFGDLVVRQVRTRRQDYLGDDNAAEVGSHPLGKDVLLYFPGAIIDFACVRSTFIVSAFSFCQKEARTTRMHLMAFYVG